MTVYQNRFENEDLMTYRKRLDLERRNLERLALLKVTPTRDLMRMRDKCYMYQDTTFPTRSDLWANREEIIAELNTREHIPNKKERKELRRQKHLRGR